MRTRRPSSGRARRAPRRRSGCNDSTATETGQRASGGAPTKKQSVGVHAKPLDNRRPALSASMADLMVKDSSSRRKKDGMGRGVDAARRRPATASGRGGADRRRRRRAAAAVLNLYPGHYDESETTIIRRLDLSLGLARALAFLTPAHEPAAGLRIVGVRGWETPEERPSFDHPAPGVPARQNLQDQRHWAALQKRANGSTNQGGSRQYEDNKL